MHEQLLNSTEVAEAFEQAEGSLYDIIEQDEFALACEQRGLDATQSVGDPGYWETVEDFVYKRVREGQRNQESDLSLAALQITASTPLFLEAERWLTSNTPMDSSQRHALRERVSYFNSLIRYVGASSPDVKVSDVSMAMHGAADIAGFNHAETDEQIRHTLRGAQHEIAFGQLLAAGDKEYRAAETEEDLHGIDYFVKAQNKVVAIDVKASLSEVEALGGTGNSYAIRRSQSRNQSDVLVMYSLARDSEFGDSFCLPDAIVTERAPRLEQFVELATKSIRAA